MGKTSSMATSKPPTCVMRCIIMLSESIELWGALLFKPFVLRNHWLEVATLVYFSVQPTLPPTTPGFVDVFAGGRARVDGQDF